MKTIILGAGYGGIATATALKPTENLDALLIDQRPYHTYYTLLHEAAGHGKTVTTPIEPLLEGTGVEFEQASVDHVDLDGRAVHLRDGRVLDYTKLVVSMGSVTNFYGIKGLEEHADVLKEIEDAEGIFDWVNRAFESSYTGSRDLIVGGAGLTGTELVTELAQRSEELSYKTGMPKLKLHLIEAGPNVLPTVDAKLRERALKVLQGYGIEILTSHKIVEASANSVTVEDSSGARREIEGGKIVWTGGIRARDLLRGEQLVGGPGGRVKVDQSLRALGYPDVFVIGDMAAANASDGAPVPSTAQHAGQMGRHTAANLMRAAQGEEIQPYEPYSQGEFVSLGGLMAVGAVNLPGDYRIALTGVAAHVMKIASHLRWALSIK
ncbi:NAD(P)/FAD-dependent oxidoreductase [Deinococcus radiophilus]|uniref:NAD(P)/FAD-dependent oxidoreductase n=1 Tax=Deinococcus radiophilus TaxID=32062 RepID=A0A3S0I5L3_9DEIO|nr:NAD(P)/FAD-dependent oxidoreductase [Deinococcus radiophilus]RTR25665.1 NAD(P)/FAD-dependent oxidoreductase [Deinococcus radiophilus]UFA50912.1 NAD(P)/FAD-dependent oxidoreductase [Deinococcus radiophilus]